MRIALLVLLVSFLPFTSIGSADIPRKGTVCWPLGFAGITVGSNSDSQVRRLLSSNGAFRAKEGHTGGRYFEDLHHTATLHVVEGVDLVVEELTVREGIDPEIKNGEHAAAVSKWFDPKEGFGKWHELHLGSSKADVLANLGEPQKRTNADQWEYESTCACEIPDYLTIRFKAGHVVELAQSEEE